MQSRGSASSRGEAAARRTLSGEAMDKPAFGHLHGHDAAFKATMDHNNANFKVRVLELNLKP